jgi:hypothetical protein
MPSDFLWVAFRVKRAASIPEVSDQFFLLWYQPK